ncbi:lipase family protein [Rhodococcus sp. NPDC058505]|uniref:lipase family protein n=1 Tax=unclassified Rhodococcus (in: high G+C Gram-positive bacteria) TaxID=192944 RepID=UPI0036495808
MRIRHGGFLVRLWVTTLAVTVVVGGGTAVAQSSGSAGGEGSVGTGSLTDGTGSDGQPLNGTTLITGSMGTGSLARSPLGSVLPPLVDAVVPAPNPPYPDLDALWQAVLPSPIGDPFFDDYPPGLPGMANGQVIETRDVTAVASQLLRGPVREVRQFKVKTTDAHGAPSFATATLVVPATPWAGPGPRPVLVNNVPINGLGRDCTPSYTLAHGITPSTNPFELLRPVTAKAEERGYAVLIPDHEGPRMAYGEPFVAGHAILDTIRGMRTLYPAEFGTSKLAMMGYSGGAIATSGAVKLLDAYAPELAADIAGAAIGGVPADYDMLGRTMNGNLAGGLFMAAVLGVARERTEILTLMNDLGERVGTSGLRNGCVMTLALLGVPGIPIEALANIKQVLSSPVAQGIFAELKMTNKPSGTPLYIYNGGQEFWIPALGTQRLFAEQCGLGVPTVYRQVPGEHVIGELTGNPGAFDWVDARLRGEPAPSGC